MAMMQAVFVAIVNKARIKAWTKAYRFTEIVKSATTVLNWRQGMSVSFKFESVTDPPIGVLSDATSLEHIENHFTYSFQ